MSSKMIEWKNNSKTEWEIMKWTYNYTKHEVIRYFRNREGIVSKEPMQVKI